MVATRSDVSLIDALKTCFVVDTGLKIPTFLMPTGRTNRSRSSQEQDG